MRPECSLCEVVDRLPDSLILASDAAWITYVHPSLADAGCVWVQTRQHVHGIWSMNEEQSSTMGTVMARAAEALRRSRGAERVYMVSFGENHPHMHALLVARPPGEGHGSLRGTALVETVLRQMGESSLDRAAQMAAEIRAGFRQ